MFRRGKWRVGWLGFEGEAISSTVTVLARDSSDNILLAKVTTAGSLPSAVAGYAYGCQMIVADSGAIYFNTGGASSCTFTVQGTLTSGTVTTTVLGSTAVTPAKMAVLGTYSYGGTAAAGGTASPSAANLIAGYCSFQLATVAGNFAIQLPSAASIQTAFGITAVGSWFDVIFANDTSYTATITGISGLTLKGTAAITTLKTARARFITTGTNTFDVVITQG